MIGLSVLKLCRRAYSQRLLAILFLGCAFLLSGCLGDQGGGQAQDPVVVENAVAFVKRPLQFANNGGLIADDMRLPAAFRPGARLFLKTSAAPSARSIDISSSAFAAPFNRNEQGQLLYDVKDLTVSYDGSRLLFAMRAPDIDGADEQDQPTWNIWEYNTETSSLRRIIESDTTAEEGHDIAPAYLADGSIVFSSTRQRTSKAILLDEGKTQYTAQDERRQSPAFVLHVMSDDGSDIEQITFNQSHDLDPTVLDDGKIVFSRWDNAGQTRNNGVNLYQINPDGTGLSYLYGRHSHASVGSNDSVQFFKPVATTARELLVQARPFQSSSLGALPMQIDVSRYVEADQTVEGDQGRGQVPLVAGLSAFGEQSLEGVYGAASPLFDGTSRFLVSWSPCRLVKVGGDGTNIHCTEERLASDEYRPALPVYGLWLLDTHSGTQLPIERPVEGQQFDEAVLMTSRPLPVYLTTPVGTDEARNLAETGYGIVHIRSVYDVDGIDIAPGGIKTLSDPSLTSPDNRPRRFVRIEKPVSQPSDEVRDFDNSAFGRSQNQLMREILGYAPVEPDGSVRLAVPANVAFAISVLDARGQRVTDRHQNWLQVRPGETVECHGCHTRDSEVPHGRPGAGPASINPGAATTGREFPNTEPALFADMGDTMAETISRINGIRQLSADIDFVDEWTDPAVVPKAESFSFAYADLNTPAPITQNCADAWTSECRVVINYEQHIHPLWGLSRPVYDADGVTEIDNAICTACHSNVDAVGAVQVPEAQLDLTDGPAPENARMFKSYRELLFNDNEQELNMGALTDRLVETGEYERDGNGELILNEAGEAIPLTATVNVPASMSPNGAIASRRFMDMFLKDEGFHKGFMSDAELKLLAEWLDLGAQYYNNPFDAPEN